MQTDAARGFGIELGTRSRDGRRGVVEHECDRRPKRRTGHLRSFSIVFHGRVFRICSFVSQARRACATPRST